MVIAPLRSDGRVVVPPGATVNGVIKDVHKVGLGIVRESARLEFDFNELVLPGGGAYPLQSRILSVDNARETVDRKGHIHGARATDSLSHRLAYRMGHLAWHHPFGAGLLFAAEASMIRFPDPEITYAAGAEMRLALEQDLPLQPSQSAVRDFTAADTAEMERLVSSMPYWSYSKRKARPMDIANLLFIGSQEAIQRAFAAAGWTGSQPMSAGAGLRIVQAIAEERSYPDAPMRTLLIDGAEPDMSWQKCLNTFTKRHHLRIWKRPERWRGEDVWLSAATWDIAAGFSFRLGLTHEIQTNVDFEREKVANDLLLTGCVESIAHVQRPAAAGGTERTWRKLQTDGKLAVLRFNSCEAPNHSLIQAAETRRPGVATRAVRRITLTARNYFIRENEFWKAGDAAAIGIRAVRRWMRAKTAGRRAELADRSGHPGNSPNPGGS